jgi:hypothetical protein
MNWRVVAHPDIIEELNQLPADVRAKLTRVLELISQAGAF